MNHFKRPESVLVVVFTARGEVLCLRRVEPADFWQSVTGSLSWHETAVEAAVREVREETGLVADFDLVDTGIVNRYPIHSAWRARYAPNVTHNTEHVFCLRLREPQPVILNPDEHAEFRWLPRDEAAKQAASDTDRDAILALVPVKSEG